MKKIPTVFLRDPENRSRVLNEVTPGCEWVLLGEGRATYKWDGTACLVRGAVLYKRRAVKPGKTAPPGYEEVEVDSVTGKSFGWVPVGDGPEDALHREAFCVCIPDGTYELVGPKVQTNRDDLEEPVLIRHGDRPAADSTPRTFESIRACLLDNRPGEGIVYYHPRGRMAKIKVRDFEGA